jgi:hypothetical protein
MHNFRYYLALTLILILAFSVRMHAATPGSSNYTRAQEVSRFLTKELQLQPHQTHLVYRLTLQHPSEEGNTASNVVGQHFSAALQQIVTPVQYTRYVTLVKKQANTQLALK